MHKYNSAVNLFFIVQGVLKGFDQATNLILDESHERVYSTKVYPIGVILRILYFYGCICCRSMANLKLDQRAGLVVSFLSNGSIHVLRLFCSIQAGVEQVVLGLHIIRGDNM